MIIKNSMNDPVWNSTKELSLKAVLDWLCRADDSRRMVSKTAIIEACKGFKIRYRLRDDLLFRSILDDSVDEERLLLKRVSFEQWYNQLNEEYEQKEKSLDPRAEKGYLNLIGVMIRIFATDEHGMKQFGSQNELKSFIAEEYPELFGLGYDSLNQKFAKANTIVTETLKKKRKNQ